MSNITDMSTGSPSKHLIKFAIPLLIGNVFQYFPLGMIYAPRAVLNGCGDTGFAMINGITEVFGRIVFSQILTEFHL